MGDTLTFALSTSGISIIILLAVLALLAGLVSLMTRFIHDKPEEEENTPQDSQTLEPAANNTLGQDLGVVAAIACALYRAQVELSAGTKKEDSVGMNSWQQFQLMRRLNQANTIRRTK